MECDRRAAADEKSTPQIQKVFDLLVKTHAGYHNFSREGNWGFAQKKIAAAQTNGQAREIVVEHVVRVEKVEVGLGAFLTRCVQKIRGH